MLIPSCDVLNRAGSEEPLCSGACSKCVTCPLGCMCIARIWLTRRRETDSNICLKIPLSQPQKYYAPKFSGWPQIWQAHRWLRDGIVAGLVHQLPPTPLRIKIRRPGGLSVEHFGHTIRSILGESTYSIGLTRGWPNVYTHWIRRKLSPLHFRFYTCTPGRYITSQSTIAGTTRNALMMYATPRVISFIRKYWMV
jgi:hypothetical protein